ncbi:SDR family NAD(P)-dependent oxidoreductase [Aestuariispira ectoiniformans]|uniref:SDR family NAD(P)-dependent oxidoreductase n=1 Tax=Aestuariispira ectoiniformans TaxID=2775080 RepID=UPI00223BC2A6|nr:SDR family NAD(P)-dependent oxidoreductase [Aestuariispira ectoiniformans]
MQLKGKTVFITGGTGGIGAPLVQLLEKAGADVTVYSGRRDGDLVENLDTVCERLKRDTPDILINMAGDNVLDYCERQDMDRLVALNMLAPMRLTQAVLPAMKARNSGQIVTMGSMVGLIPLPHVTGYAAAKAGLKGFSDSLRRELGGTGIAVTHIAPRAVSTPMNNGIKAEVNQRTKVKSDSPAKVAQRTFQAIVGREREVRFGWPERFFAMLNALLPSVVDNGLQSNRRIGESALNGKQESHVQRAAT